MNDPTNSDRAEWALEALNAYGLYHLNAYGAYHPGGTKDVETMIVDVLSSLHHLALRTNLRIDHLFAKAKVLALDEIEEECEKARNTLRENGCEAPSA